MKQGNLTFESQIGDVYNTYKFETIDVDKWNLISKKKDFGVKKIIVVESMKKMVFT